MKDNLLELDGEITQKEERLTSKTEKGRLQYSNCCGNCKHHLPQNKKTVICSKRAFSVYDQAQNRSITRHLTLPKTCICPDYVKQ